MIDPFSNSAFKYGFGLFETMRAINSEIIFFDEHINRLNSSLKYFGLSPVEKELIKRKLLSEINKRKLKDARIRITYSLQKEKPLITFEFAPYTNSFPQLARITVSNYLLKHNEELRKHKTTNYFINYYEYRKARSSNYDEVIFCDDKGHILEGSRTNIFLVFYKKNFNDLKICTPTLKCGILPGVAREKIIQVCKSLKIKIEVSPIPKKLLYKANEIFLSNSLNGIIPVTTSSTDFKKEITYHLKEHFDKYFNFN